MPDFIIRRREKKEYEQFTTRIEVGLLDKVRSIVLENNLNSVNGFINECIRFSINNLKVMNEADKDSEWKRIEK